MDGLVLALLIIGGSVGYGVLAVVVGRKIAHRHVGEGHNDVLEPVFCTAGVIYAVLLGFMVVAVWQAYDDAHANVSEEAAILVPLYRQTIDMASDKGPAMRGLIRQCTRNVDDDEWRTMQASGNGSAKARQSIGDLVRLFGTLTPSTDIRKIIATQFLQTLSQVILDRNKRISESSESLSWVMWLGAVGGGAIIVGMSSVLHMDRRWPHVLMVAVMSGLIGLLIFIIAVLSRPFVGPLALDPAPFEHSVAAFNDVDQGK
jgi:hypothetical protein